MVRSHISILKANQGEREALKNLDERTARRVEPLFEIGRLTDAIRERKYIRDSDTPVITYLNRFIDAVGDVWKGRPAMIDGYHWLPNARAEDGQHVIAYMVARLRAAGVTVIPVIGYDRWGNAEYRMGVRSIPASGNGRFCLRLDSSAYEDAAEPEHFEEVIGDIVEELELDPASCTVLLDFGDISMDATSLEFLVSKSSDIIEQLNTLGFERYAVAGCSLPKTIDLAVSDKDSVGLVLRKEMLLWQTLRLGFPNVAIHSGDYGVRGPTTTETPSKHTNGKIRHTVRGQIFVARGHSFNIDHNQLQMHGLASVVVQSPHFLGEAFSWGDGQILACSHRAVLGGTTKWIAIDTNHHLTFVVQEVDEFELAMSRQQRASQNA